MTAFYNAASMNHATTATPAFPSLDAFDKGLP